jgi:hypothetical protein
MHYLLIGEEPSMLENHPELADSGSSTTPYGVRQCRGRVRLGCWQRKAFE